jgi:cytoskeletal protein RodZ
VEEKKIERVKQHKRLLIITSSLILLSLIVTSVYWQTLKENPQPSPSSYPSPTPTLSPSSSPSPSPPPSQTPTPSSSSSPTSTPTPIDLYPKEIREYEGEYLSSINVFRENSIAGPQYVDKNNYHLTITGLVNETMEYTYDEVINGFQKYRKVVTLFCVEGWTAKILW